MPLFLTQGMTENNTVADGTAQYLRNHTGFERAWLGPWEHVRGNETDSSGRLKMGRAGLFDEVMRFYDRFLKGTTPAVDDPPVAVQTNDGTWRAENVYDLDEYGIGPLITRQGFLARSSGSKTLDLWSADWKIPAGHRIGVRVTDANEDWWIHTPTFGDVQVVGGSVTLPFLARQRTETIQGDRGTQLAGYLDETITVPPVAMRESVSQDFAIPPEQTP